MVGLLDSSRRFRPPPFTQPAHGNGRPWWAAGRTTTTGDALSGPPPASAHLRRHSSSVTHPLCGRASDLSVDPLRGLRAGCAPTRWADDAPLAVRRPARPALPRRRRPAGAAGRVAAVFRRRRFHRQKAHLVLSAMRHRAAELGDRVRATSRADTYGDGARARSATARGHATRRRTRALRLRRAARRSVEVLPGARLRDHARATSPAGPAVAGARRLLMEDFYRDARRRHGVLMDGAEPAGGRWNFDADNREPPPKGAADARGPRAVVAGRGRDRRRGARRPRPLGARRRRLASSATTARAGSPRPAPRRCTALARLRRAPAAGVRRRTRTRCSPATRGWRTRCSRRR